MRPVPHHQLTDDPGFGLYVHWPYCLSKCPYCDFNSHVAAGIDHEAWRVALLTALRRMADRAERLPLRSIFFGGGTPSLMAPATVGAIIEDAMKIFPSTDDLEVTLEANPTSVEAGRFAGFRAAGVNRVSIGVQALDDVSLRFLGRTHSAAEALAAVALARRSFPRISFDLIYARPGQGEAAWADELGRALALEPEHLSLYQLTYEPETPFGMLHARGRLPAIEDARAVGLYDLTQSLCAAAGLPAYEISNHARPGAECRHNLVYWRYGTYLGLGPGAHGRVKGQATAGYRAPDAWLADVASGGDGTESIEALTPAARASEYLLMSLRLSEGTRLSRYERLSGVALPQQRILSLCDGGFLLWTDDIIRATPAGRLVLNRLIAELDP